MWNKLTMKDNNALHVGSDGVDLRGRDSIMVFILLVFAGGLTWIFLQQVDKSIALNESITARMEVMSTDHNSLKSSVEANTRAITSMGDQVELQNWLLLANPQQEAEAKKRIGVPKLLQGNNPYPIRP